MMKMVQRTRYQDLLRQTDSDHALLKEMHGILSWRSIRGADHSRINLLTRVIRKEREQAKVYLAVSTKCALIPWYCSRSSTVFQHPNTMTSSPPSSLPPLTDSKYSRAVPDRSTESDTT
jgi:hypothetical protein